MTLAASAQLPWVITMAVKSVNINDKGFKKAVAALERLAKMQVKVGIQSDTEDYSDGVSVVDVAVWNEYGTDKIPSRPFIRQCFKDNSDEALTRLSELAQKTALGDDPKSGLGGIGQWYQDRMRRTLLTFQWEPNSPATVKRKRKKLKQKKTEENSSQVKVKPLVDTGQLVNSIRYKLEE